MWFLISIDGGVTYAVACRRFIWKKGGSWGYEPPLSMWRTLEVFIEAFIWGSYYIVYHHVACQVFFFIFWKKILASFNLYSKAKTWSCGPPARSLRLGEPGQRWSALPWTNLMEWWNTGMLEYWRPAFSAMGSDFIRMARIRSKNQIIMCFWSPKFHHSIIPLFRWG